MCANTNESCSAWNMKKVVEHDDTKNETVTMEGCILTIYCDTENLTHDSYTPGFYKTFYKCPEGKKGDDQDSDDGNGAQKAILSIATAVLAGIFVYV